MYDQIETVLIPQLDAGTAMMKVRREKGQWKVVVVDLRDGHVGEVHHSVLGATLRDAMTGLDRQLAVH